jgi:hypothetical protein
MKRPLTLCIALLVLVACASSARAQAKASSPTSSQPPARRGANDAQSKNIQAYIQLIRKDVQRQKSEIMRAVILLDAEDSAKFWPIYNEYDAELSKVNNLRSDNIQEYARTYLQMTDEKADELIKRALDFHKQRSELLARYYERMKEAVGAITAARFVQIENQLLMLIDLRIASELPIVGER